MSVENMRSTMHIDPKRDVLYSIPDSDNHGDLLIRPQGIFGAYAVSEKA